MRLGSFLFASTRLKSRRDFISYGNSRHASTSGVVLTNRPNHSSSGLSLDKVMLWGVPLGIIAVFAEAYLRTDLADAESPQKCGYDATCQLIQAHHVRTLEQKSIVVIPNALQLSVLKAGRKDLVDSLLVEDGPMALSGGNDHDVRQDRVAWIRNRASLMTINEKSGIHHNMEDREDDLNHCIRLIRGVTNALQRHEYRKQPHQSNATTSSSNSKEHPQQIDFRVPRQLQAAFYPGDNKSLYKRHLDQCQSSIWELGLLEWLRLSDYRQRSITAILYLNEPDRPPSDGGALRCWVATSTTESNTNDNGSAKFRPPFDIQPKGGTLVIFESDKVEHMVLPSSKDRYALTSWVSQV